MTSLILLFVKKQ